MMDCPDFHVPICIAGMGKKDNVGLVSTDQSNEVSVITYHHCVVSIFSDTREHPWSVCFIDIEIS